MEYREGMKWEATMKSGMKGTIWLENKRWHWLVTFPNGTTTSIMNGNYRHKVEACRQARACLQYRNKDRNFIFRKLK